ncbi:hypothetical protein BU24DRAFT_495594 [Aaosphaeria arxii CBS 175.79]|uniref:N-acetyltransferase domain-containing protein n=1 Tax=Aaosphaeria arxii CBS 175.79 TaxID=1450172 RepID=A0A6A5XGB2_9PLEO|nr:uncharacterized protein BU24DRAFT_495594 [Aaosphaeria arxii CBS 175.79]KAF2011404.1 hypothetical protein BU24DRAFT_495594 [Aaosphaeria arxii CBS 175.79]
MGSEKNRLFHQSWRKDSYFISTDPALIPIKKLNEAFASEQVYWTEALPEDILRETIENSLSFGLYRLDESKSEAARNISPGSPDLELVGFARCITDYTTFIYLTDVYVDASCQGKGLGAWMIGCVQEVIDSMPYLRRSLLFTGDWKRSVPFYEKLMGMSVMECKRGEDGKSGVGVAIMQKKGPQFPSSLN